jgi:hypothetical protein
MNLLIRPPRRAMRRRSLLARAHSVASLPRFLGESEAAEHLRYPRWGGDGEAVQLGKSRGVESCLKTVRIPSVGCTLCSAAQACLHDSSILLIHKIIQ